MNTPANTRKSQTSSHTDLNKLMKYNSPLCIVKLARDDLKILDHGKKINSIKSSHIPMIIHFKVCQQGTQKLRIPRQPLIKKQRLS
jgi:hypothetical protein